MRRKIKFRAWHKYKKRHYCVKWIYMDSGTVGIHSVEIDGGELRYFDYAEKLDNLIIEQFTGLYDSTKWAELTVCEKNDYISSGQIVSEWPGKEIYEGDIITLSCGCCFYEIVYDQDNARFWPKDDGQSQVHIEDIDVWKCECRVVGHTHEDFK